MNIAELKTNKFEFIRLKNDSVDHFTELKEFCGNDIKISYELAPGIDYYWLIQLYDCIKEKEVVVPNGYYILKVDDGFTLISSVDFNNYFNDISNNIKD